MLKTLPELNQQHPLSPHQQLYTPCQPSSKPHCHQQLPNTNPNNTNNNQITLLPTMFPSINIVAMIFISFPLPPPTMPTWLTPCFMTTNSANLSKSQHISHAYWTNNVNPANCIISDPMPTKNARNHAGLATEPLGPMLTLCPPAPTLQALQTTTSWAQIQLPTPNNSPDMASIPATETK